MSELPIKDSTSNFTLGLRAPDFFSTWNLLSLSHVIKPSSLLILKTSPDTDDDDRLKPTIIMPVSVNSSFCLYRCSGADLGAEKHPGAG